MVMRRHPSSLAGVSRLGCVIQLAILAGILYFGAYAGQDLLKYFEYRDAMKQEARFATLRSDQQIKDRLSAFADSVDLPSDAKDINIVRDENTIRIWAEYDQPLRLPFDIQKAVHLRPSVEDHI
jgi:hypothetical protein